MKRTSSRFYLGLQAALFLATAPGHASETLLNIGSPAPAIRVEKWIKGTPIRDFEEGTIYVMEFWATWCGPCKAAMPKLSELARGYKDRVVFVGVNVFERGEETTKKVEAFVINMGDTMDYNVCADGSAAFMAGHWLQAAGESGIPCTFVVDGGGQIAWIGHPNELEDVLDKVIAGTADYRQLAKTREAAKSGAAIQPSVTMEIQMAIDAKDYAETVKAIDRVAATNPIVAKKFQAEKLRALMFTDETEGMAFGRAILERTATNPTSTVDLVKAGVAVATADGLSKQAYELAIDLLTQACKATPGEPAPGMMRINVNVEAVKRLIEATRSKAASQKD